MHRSIARLLVTACKMPLGQIHAEAVKRGQGLAGKQPVDVRISDFYSQHAKTPNQGNLILAPRYRAEVQLQ